ncbi:MAG TPA: protease pro-enzyme activation domain-containing protein [Gammaproteobacteria bacterium]|nr:protease pro-enzyme activation domain-containing protein [Gammaproteobacteria bacterium]
MSRKLLTVALSLLVLVTVAGAIFLPTSSALPRLASRAMDHKDLTAQAVANAHKSGLPPTLATMAPQSNLKLLSRATRVGPHATQSPVSLTVGLKLRNEAKLKSFLQQVQNPVSPVYHQWLTPQEFTARFGPSKDQVAQVVSYLEARGIKVKAVSANRMLIHTEATTQVYNHAFGIEINDYKLNGRSFYSTMDRPKLPQTIAPFVTNILGLNHAVQMHPHHFMAPLQEAAARGLSSNEVAPPASLTNLNPLQIAHAYDWPDITDAANGTGVSVAILTAVSSGLASNSSPHVFWGAFGLPDHTINVIPVDGNYGNTSGMGETLLDVEMGGAMGPGAALNVYVAADTYLATFTDMYNQFVNDNISDVMTTSWGAPETLAPELDATDNQIFMQAAAEGISMFAAAGDNGSGDGTGQSAVADFPSSSPYITAANGTQLTIADLNGTYGSEIVWNDALCFNKAPASTGGAISQQFAKPGWQRGPGVPADVDMRMNSGIALTASCSHPMMIYQAGGWYLTAGTSGVAPQLAGLFAIAVSKNGGRLGQSNSLIYDHANVNYAGDFHDITNGNNGAFEAGPGWDHPTGWGSVDAAKLISHIALTSPKGTLEGKVTDAGNGEPVVGAMIKVGDQKIVSADDGSYSAVLPAGDVTVTVSAFGYEGTSATVHVADGGTITQDFALATAPKVILSGTVTDGSGHGYGLYADIKVTTGDYRQVADVWTDPQTGKYRVELADGNDYSIHVAAALDGYNPVSTSVTLSGNKTQNFTLTAASTCQAPGYTFSGAGGFSEDFNGGAVPPAGWTETNPVSGSVVWLLSSQQASDNGNYTGGTGDAASASSNSNDQDGSPYDTSLVTPPIPVASLPAGPVLRYKANYQTNPWTVGDNFEVDISTDGGVHWTSILHWNTAHGAFWGTPGENVQVGLAQYLPATGDFQLRWRYYGGGWNQYAQLDDVVIGSCAPLPGSLIVGRITDANNDAGAVGAHVEDDQGAGANVVANPADDDADHPNPLYMFFASQGTRTLTVTSSNYSTATADLQVPNNQVVRQDFTLKAAQLEAAPNALTVHVPVGGSTTASFVLKNMGGGAGTFRIFPIDAPPPASGEARAVVHVPVKHPAWMMAGPLAYEAHFKTRGQTASAVMPKAEDVTPHADQAGQAWRGIASYPPIFAGQCASSGPCVGIAENTAARDPATGKIYSMGGFSQVNGGFVNVLGVKLAYVFDIGSPNPVWTPIADAPVARMSPVSAFVNGKFYVFDGWDGAVGGNPTAEVDIYDPATDTWSQGTPNPVPAASSSAAAVLNGLVYIVGGCNDGSCSKILSAVQVYNPVANSWSSAANYPVPVDDEACGGIDGKLYCAGGVDGTTVLTSGYVYDPVSNTWSPIASMPVAGLGGSAYTAANGMLLMAGGIMTGGAGISLTNRAVAYDPGTDSWMALPPLNEPVWEAAGACGFYAIGGVVGVSDFFGDILTPDAEMLPGYDQLCGEPSPIQWLTVASTQSTLEAGASATVTLTFDGTGQTAFTTSNTYLSIINNTPYGPLTVPVTVQWDPQPVDLVLSADQSPTRVLKGGNLTYNLTVANRQGDSYGAATQTTVTYQLPDGTTYVAASGDGTCKVLSAGLVSCDFGTVGPGASKTAAIVVKVATAGTLKSTFSVNAREPDSDVSNDAVSLDTTVIGQADVSVNTSTEKPTRGKSTMQFEVSNTGPDPATDVQLDLKAEGSAKLVGATSGKGSCTASNGNFSCNIGEIAAGGKVAVMITASLAHTGTATVQGQAITSSEDPDSTNNIATATVEGAPTTANDTADDGNSDGGGGAFGWLALIMLLGVTCATRYARNHR